MTVSRLRVLFVGDFRHSEFLDARDWLESNTDWQGFEEVGAAVAHLLSSSLPIYDLILIGQARPGQINSHEIERLHATAPLTPILAVLGSWCEGEMRTGVPCKGIPRLYWHQLLPALTGETATERSSTQARIPMDRPFQAGEIWKLPRTASEPERFLRAAEHADGSRGIPATPRKTSDSISPRPGTGVWLIRAETWLTFESLAACMRRGGLECVWWPARALRPRPYRLAGIVWDTEQLDELEWRRLEEESSLLRQSPSVVLVNFPRHDEACKLSSLGIASLISKPFRIEWLLDEITRLETKWGAARLLENGPSSQGLNSTDPPRHASPINEA